MASSDPSRGTTTSLGRVVPPSKPAPVQTTRTAIGGRSAGAANNLREKTSQPFEFRGFDFFARRDFQDFRNASKSYFTTSTYSSGRNNGSTDPASWLGDATPPPSPTIRERPDAAGGFPIPSGGRPPRRRKETIFGLKRSWFWVVLALLIFLFVVAIGIGVGVGVGGKSDNGSQASPESAPAVSPTTQTATTTATTTISPSGTTSTATSTPTGGNEAKIDCPAANGTTYQVPGSTKQFMRICGLDYNGEAEATDLGQVYTETVLDCIKNCAGTFGCTGCGWGFLEGDMGVQHRCWLKSELKQGHEADENWSFAVLL